MATAVVLRYYNVPLPTTVRFVAYLGLGVVLPGTLLWRVLRGRSDRLVADAAAGAALGYTVEVLAYVAARWAGAPLLVLAWPIGMVTVALAVPRFRRYWRSAPGRRTPAAWAWSLVAVLAVFVFRSVRHFRGHGLGWPVSASTDADTPFHWALIGEAKHHMPMQAPWVSGERLVYHWFAYPEMAATSWVTGIDPLTLLVRLSPLPMVVAFLVLVAVLAGRLTGRWWTGPAAVVAALLVLAPNPYGWRLSDAWFGFGPVEDGSIFRLTAWTSPTQTFGALLFAALMLVLVDILEPAPDGPGPRGGAGRWVLVCLLLAGVSGAKSPYLPMLTGALLAAVALLVLTRRGLCRPMLVLAGLVALFTAGSQLVLYGGAGQGLVVEPLAIMSTYESMAAAMTGYTGPGAPFGRLAVIGGLTVLSWLLMWGGVLAARGRLLDPAVLLLLCVGLVGLAGVLVFGHPGGSQGYLIVSGRPIVAIISVVGFPVALGSGPVRAGRAWSLVAAVAAGVGAVWLVRLADGPALPAGNLAWELARPNLALAGGAAAAAAALFTLRRLGWLRSGAVALLVCWCAGFGLASAGDGVRAVADDVVGTYGSGTWHAVDPAKQLGPDGRASAVDRDTYAVGRWLRDHADPDDLLATNAHCFGVHRPGGPCDNRRFGLSAASQRRVLVEGWGFTNSTYLRAAEDNVPPWFAEFWDRQRLADNDAAFTNPSPETVGLLRDRYGVRWLVVDASVTGSADLGGFAVPRYTSGLCTVYELPR
ncbi:hypothetical protein GCM10010399_66530 [Dactylosporangium fulvum]|uniref:hypothetical protein n=1 Tax=Dactylosporangium fulvum TaxID=53359 RepID=UPI0031DDEF1D